MTDRTQPISSYFTPEEIQAIIKLLEAYIRVATTNATKTYTQGERGGDDNIYLEWTGKAEQAQMYLDVIQHSGSIIYDIKEEDFSDIICNRINANRNKYSDEKRKFHDNLATKIYELVY